jgi:phage-related protein
VAQQAYAYVTLIPVAEGFQKAIAKEMGGVGNVGLKAGQDAGEGLKGGFGKAIAGLAGIIAGAFTVRALTNFAKESVLAAEAVATADARVAQINKTMGLFGDDTDKVSQRLVDFAKANEVLLAVDENVIKSTQAKLLTFGGLAQSADVVGGAFDRATMAAIDLEAAGFGPAENQAVALGKALNDPTKGLSALSRSGITFTEVEKEKIAALQESGDLLGAQNVLLEAIEGQVKGTAAATADASVQMSLAFGNIKEAVGAELLPVFNDLVQEMLPVIDEVIPVFRETIQTLTPVVSQLAAQFPDLMRALFPIIPIIGELAGIFLNLAAQLLPIIVRLFDQLMPAIRDLVPVLATFISEAMEILVPILVDLIDALVPIVMALLPVFMDLFKALAPVAVNLINSMMPLVVRILPILIALIEFLTPILVIVAEIIGVVLVTAANLFVGAIEWIVIKLTEFATFFENTWNGIKSFFQDVVNGLIAGFEGFVNGAIKGVNRVIDAINSLSFTVPDWVPDIGGKRFGFNLKQLAEISLPRVEFAKGGMVTGPTNALIGEAGPEVVIPLDRFERMMGLDGNQGQTVNYYAAPNQSFTAEDELLLAMRRAKLVIA